MSSSDEEELLLLYALTPRRKRKRRQWVQEINQKREELGEYQRLCSELESHEDRFFIYFRMSRSCFEELHDVLKPRIMKHTTNWRRPIGSKERLAICLRYLSTGDSHQTIASSFRIGRSTVSKIVKEVCHQLWKVLQPLYLPTPTQEIWKQTVMGFQEEWGFPNCMGCIDNKHVKLKGSAVAVIALLAIVDSYSKFIIVDIDSYERHNDSTFENSYFYRDFITGKTILPPKPLPGTTNPISHIFIGDETFVLQTYLMRPYPRATSADNARKKTFNQQLSRVRGVVKSAFGILAQNWSMFFRPIETDVETAIQIVRAACCLHNYVLRNSKQLPAADIDEYEQPVGAFSGTTPTNRRSPNAAFQVRECFADYFSNK